MRIACVVVLLGCQQGAPQPASHEAVGAAPVVARSTPPFDVPAPADPVIAIGRGEQHACVVHASGAVDCWGQPMWCPTCEAPKPPDRSVRRLDGISDAVAISADGRCFVKRTGDAACIDRQTGNLTPIGAHHVRATGGDGCAILESGVADCDDWTAPEIHDATAIASVADGHVVCVIRKSGQLACREWSPSFAVIAGVDHVRALAIAYQFQAGSPLVCVLAPAARCFHLRDFAASDQDYDVPKIDPAAFAGATQIAVSERDGKFEVDALVGGKVVVADLQGTRTLPLLTDAKQLTAGCVVRATGAIACWGTNAGGALGQPTTLGRIDVPATPVPGVTNIASVVAGNTETWALTREGHAVHWGVRDDKPELVPAEIHFGDSFDTEPIAQLLIDYGTACARGTLGHVWCELDNYGKRSVAKLPTSGITRMEQLLGELRLYHADGTGEYVEYPFGGERDSLEPLRGYDDAIETVQLDSTTCRRFSDGRVTCEHTPMPALTGASVLAGSGHVGCALVAKRVSCWTEGKTDVHAIGTIAEATDLKLGYDFGCAVDGGRVVCWHLDDEKPRVVIESGAESIGLGEGSRARYGEIYTEHIPPMAGNYGCAVMLDHTVQCWGANFFGELIDSSFLSSASPVGIRL